MSNPNKTKVVLDLAYGQRGYMEAMSGIIEKTGISYRGDPQEVANKLITSGAQYYDKVLPGIDLGELSAFLGAVLGAQLSVAVANGQANGEQATRELTAILYTSFSEAVTRAVSGIKKSRAEKAKVTLQ